ncbi:T9SS type A sorting domain-containing protein [Halocola ammonii]
MKNISLFLLLSLPAISLAQPVINSSNFIISGDTQIRWIELEYTDVTDLSGSNQTWDLSDLEASGTEENFGFIPSEGTPFEDNFPSANYAWTMENSAYFYHDISTTKWDELGFAFTEEETDVTLTYSNPRTILSFPLAYSSTHEDDYAGSLSGFGFETQIAGNYSYVVDGYGTLILPSGTLNNVLRLKVEYQETTSFMGEVGEVENTTIYQFYVNGIPYPVAAIQYTEYESEDGIEVESYSYYTDQTISGVEENVQPVSVEVWPNPANEMVNVKVYNSSETLEVNIFDINGKLVKQQVGGMKGTNQFHISTEDLSSGFYTIQVIQPGSSKAIKLIVE